MLRSSITIILRQLWRQKLFTVLNILGIAIGISACWVIYRIVDYEFSFDKKHPNAQYIYQIVNEGEREGKASSFGGIARGLPLAIKNEVSGVELTVPIYHKYDQKVSIFNERQEEIRSFEQPKHQVSVSDSYFELVPYQWLVGTPSAAFSAPNQVVFTKSRAKQYFPDTPLENLLGKTLFYNDTVRMSISGIVLDLDFPSSFNAQEFSAITDQEWNSDRWVDYNYNDVLFVKLAPGVNADSFLKQVNSINQQHTKDFFDGIRYKQWYEMIPLAEKHFVSSASVNEQIADKKVMYGLMGVAGFILLLACINYINLSTAQVPQRAKEIGIRKTLGSSPSQLIKRFLGETFFTTIFAVGLSFVISFFAMRFFSDFIPQGMEGFQNYKGLTAFIFALVLFITLFSGLYPAWLVTRVQTVDVLKGQTKRTIGKVRFNLRKGLIVFQFIIAQVFVVAAIIVGQQLQYTLNKNLGFDREAVMTIDFPSKVLNNPIYKDKQFVLKEELVKRTDVVAVALGDKPLNALYSFNEMVYQSDTGKIQERVYLKFIDEHLLGLYDFKIIAGNQVDEADSRRGFLINETAVKAFGFGSPEQALGKQLNAGNSEYVIAGVVKDFHNFSFKKEISPVMFVFDKGMLQTVNIKLPPANPQQWQRTISEIEQTWKGIYPDVSFEYKFYDETIANLYTEESKTSKLVSLATGISVLISCLGLFGLATLTASQRIKEIGIRKVLGASLVAVIQLLSIDFLKLVMIAILIASPIAWWTMDVWLQDFVFRINIEWWMFVLAGTMAVTIALVTVSFQAVKAAIANPVDSLRDE